MRATSRACRFGLYYSQPDWHHPDAFTPDRHDRYLAYLKEQVTELCSNYGQIDILWFDGLGKSAGVHGEGLVRIIRRSNRTSLSTTAPACPRIMTPPSNESASIKTAARGNLASRSASNGPGNRTTT